MLPGGVLVLPGGGGTSVEGGTGITDIVVTLTVGELFVTSETVFNSVPLPESADVSCRVVNEVSG